MRQYVGGFLAITLNAVLLPVSAQVTSQQLLLPPEHFDPLAGVPAVPANLSADPAGQLFIVHFNTQPTLQFKQEITTLGGTVYSFQ